MCISQRNLSWRLGLFVGLQTHSRPCLSPMTPCSHHRMTAASVASPLRRVTVAIEKEAPRPRCCREKGVAPSGIPHGSNCGWSHRDTRPPPPSRGSESASTKSHIVDIQKYLSKTKTALRAAGMIRVLRKQPARAAGLIHVLCTHHHAQMPEAETANDDGTI